MITDSQKNRVAEQKNPAKQDGLTHGDKNNAHILRIPHIRIQANNNQFSWWVIRRWCASTTSNKINEAPNNNHYPGQEQDKADEMCRSQINPLPLCAGGKYVWNQP